ncbi:hypothetical protein BJX62DRAFT_180043 [Aspergillus germanicus]
MEIDSITIAIARARLPVAILFLHARSNACIAQPPRQVSKCCTSLSKYISTHVLRFARKHQDSSSSNLEHHTISIRKQKQLAK